MRSTQQPVRATTILVWAIGFGLVVDGWADGPAGIGVLIAGAVAACGLVLTARPSPGSLVFLAAAMVSVSFVVVRASPVLIGLDVASGIGLFALAAAFDREGELVRTGLRSYVARSLAWVASVRPALAILATPITRLRPAGGRLLPVVPRACSLPFPSVSCSRCCSDPPTPSSPTSCGHRSNGFPSRTCRDTSSSSAWREQRP